MIDTANLVISHKTLKILGNDIDPWMMSSYKESGIYFSEKANWYFIVSATELQGVSKRVFEAVFVETNNPPAENKPTEQLQSGLDEQLFLKTIALLSGKASDYKQL